MSQEQVAQAQTAPAAPAPSDQATAKKPDPVEQHIKRLHERLKLTAAQEPQWDALAQVMRDNAHAMQSVIQKRRSAKSMTAPDDLRSYQEAAETHVQNLQKMIPAFQTLYDSMSDEQKKNADTVFSQERRHGRRHKPAQ